MRLVKERDADTFHLPDPPLSAHPHFVFGASDAPLKGAELDKFGLVQFPMVRGGIVPVVNIEGIKPGELVLDGATRAGIFLGKVKNWDNSAIKKAQPERQVALATDRCGPPVRGFGDFCQLHELFGAGQSRLEIAGRLRDVSRMAGRHWSQRQ